MYIGRHETANLRVEGCSSGISVSQLQQDLDVRSASRYHSAPRRGHRGTWPREILPLWVVKILELEIPKSSVCNRTLVLFDLLIVQAVVVEHILNEDVVGA